MAIATEWSLSASRSTCAAAAAGARCELVVVDGSDHVFLGVPIEPQWDRAIDFLLATL